MPLYKPRFDNGGGGVVTPGRASNITVKAPDGTVVYTGGGLVGTEGTKFQLPVDKIPAGSTFSIDGQGAYVIKDPFQRNEYGSGNDPVNVGGRGSSGGGGGLDPYNFGAGASPSYLGGQFPSFEPIDYKNISAPKYNQVDPAQFSELYGKAIRNDILENFSQSQGLALGTLATELKGLKAFTPAAAALAREQASIDNQFNQQQRTAQLQSTIPGVTENLRGQTDRAATYASGRLPNSFDDTALEYGIRSRAADSVTARGFGDNSLIGKSVSDVMSAEQRFQIAQYGEGLIGQNAQVRSNLELAPTEYINAGQQVKVTPSVDAGQYTRNYTTELNQLNTLPAATAFQGLINQNQFSANQRLETKKFNAVNNLNTDQFNATNGFSAQLGFFNYQNGFANNLAGLQTAQINQAREDAQRQQLVDQFNSSRNQAQGASTIQSIIGGLGNLPGILGSFGIGGGSSGGMFDSIIGGLGSLFGGGTSTASLGLDGFSLLGSDQLNIIPDLFSSSLGSSTGTGIDAVLSSLPSEFGIDLGSFAEGINFF